MTLATAPAGSRRRAALPRSARPGAKKALAGIWDAADKDHARAAAKAVAIITIPLTSRTR
jgi:hypothetical protein